MADKIITIFGSSFPQGQDKEYKEAYNVGKCLARSGFTICNGGYGGTMEAAARGAKEAGGKTIGVTFENPFKRTANKWIDEEIFQGSLIDRLLKLIELGDGYVVLKGGTGTLLEFAAVWEFINKKLLAEKPIVVIGDFWEDVVETLRKELLEEGAADCTKYIKIVSSTVECAEYLKKRLAD